MGLKDARSSYTYVNIKQGQLVVKVDNEIKTYRSLEGVIKKVEFIFEEFEGRKIEKVKFLLENEVDNRPFIFTIKFIINRSSAVVRKTLQTTASQVTS